MTLTTPEVFIHAAYACAVFAALFGIIAFSGRGA